MATRALVELVDYVLAEIGCGFLRHRAVFDRFGKALVDVAAAELRGSVNVSVRELEGHKAKHLRGRFGGREVVRRDPVRHGIWDVDAVRLHLRDNARPVARGRSLEHFGGRLRAHLARGKAGRKGIGRSRALVVHLNAHAVERGRKAIGRAVPCGDKPRKLLVVESLELAYRDAGVGEVASELVDVSADGVDGRRDGGGRKREVADALGRALSRRGGRAERGVHVVDG